MIKKISEMIRDLNAVYDKYKKQIKVVGGSLAVLFAVLVLTPFGFTQFGDTLLAHRILVYSTVTVFFIRAFYFIHVDDLKGAVRNLTTMIVIVVLGIAFHVYDYNQRLMPIELDHGLRKAIDHNKYGLSG